MLKDIKNYFANFDGATNACRTVALWVCIVLAVAFVASRLYILVLGKKSKRYGAEELAAASKVVNGAWIIIALLVAVGLIVTFTACYFVGVAQGEEALQPILFYPLLIAVVAAVGSAIAIFVKPEKIVKIVAAAVCGCALVAVVVCMIVYYASGEAGEALSDLGLYLSAGVLVAAEIAFAFLVDRKSGAFDTRAVTFAAVCVALSFALSYVRIFKMPMGGSITFASMLPLMLFAFMFGSRKGILVGLVYGLLQAVQDPWIIHPAQFVLDYAAAFAAIGLAGCMRDLGLFEGKMRTQFVLGACIACAVRFLCHYFAGVFAFGMYGADFAESYNMPALANEYFYSFVYQCMYIIPELIVVIAASMLVFASKSFRKQIDLYSNAARGERKPPVTEPAN